MKRTQGLLLANYTIPKANVPYPMAITGMIQYVTSELAATGSPTPKAYEVAVALMTNPLGSTNFGFNYEIAYTSFDSDVPGADKVNNVTFSLEANRRLLSSFPVGFWVGERPPGSNAGGVFVVGSRPVGAGSPEPINQKPEAATSGGFAASGPAIRNRHVSDRPQPSR